MGLIVIPSDYVEDVSRVVPIYIQDEDPKGNRIARGWIEAVIRAADGIRWLALTILLDQWRSSELADESLQEVWKEHGEDFGDSPHGLIYSHAQWKALDKTVGGSRIRKGLDVELRNHVLAALQKPPDFTAEVERREFFERLDERLRAPELVKVRQLVKLALRDEEIDFKSVFGKSEGAAKKEFWRKIKRILRRLQ